MAESIIPIPLGRGIDRLSDEYLTGAPAVHAAHNVRLTKHGAYEKRPGAQELGVAIVGNRSTALAPRKGHGEEDIAIYGSRKAAVISGSGSSRDLGFGALIPTQVITRKLWSPAGAVSHVNVAHNKGYTAVCATVADDFTNISVNNVEAAAGQIAIFDEDWVCIWGPHRVEELALLPRVEPITDSDGVPGFVFFGLSDPLPTSNTEGGLSNEKIGLYASRVFVSSSMGDPTVIPITTNMYTVSSVRGATSASSVIVYDTHGDGDSAFVTWYEHGASPATVNLELAAIRPTGSPVRPSAWKFGIPIEDTWDLAIWHDVDNDCVLLYNEADKLIYSSVASSSLETGTVTPSAVTLNNRPAFYKDELGRLWLTDRLLAVSGMTVTVFASDGIERYLGRRPQPYRDRGVAYINLFREGVANRTIPGLSPGHEPEIVCVSQTPTGLDFPHVVVQLNKHRVDDGPNTNNKITYHKLLSSLDAVRAGELGQTALTEHETLLVPQVVATPVYLVGAGDEAVSYDAQFTGAQSRFDTQGTIVVNEVVFDSAPSSSIPLNGSVLVAAGNLHVFDGSVSFDPCFDDWSAQMTETTWAVPDVSGKYTLDIDKAVSYIGILVYTDRNGVKYRSDAVIIGTPANIGGDKPIDVTQAWEVFLRNSALPQVFAGGIELEVYRSDRFDWGPDPVPTNYKWIGTIPLILDDTPNPREFIRCYADGTNLPITEPAIETAPYTESELGNVKPPALSVLARAGNYVFGLAYENPYEIWHSKPLADFIGPEFNPNLVLYAPPESGGVVSLAGIADRLYLLCRYGVWEVYVANGPDASGQGLFPVARKVWSGDGCVTHNWTVPDTPYGVVFCSNSGPKLIDTSGQVVDIGMKIRGLWDAERARCATYDPITREVWLFQSEGDGGVIEPVQGTSWTASIRSLVYNFDLGEWTTSSFYADAAFMFHGKLSRALGSTILQHTEGYAYDDEDYFLARVSTPWISLTATQGYFRLKRLASLLRLSSGDIGKLRIRIEYDYDSTTSDASEWSVADIGILDKKAQFRVKPGQQKVESFRVHIEEDTEESPDKEQPDSNLLWSLAGLTVKTQQKRGVVKLQEGASG